MGIRTVAGFMIGFPHDTAVSIRAVLRHAKELNPTFANFNIVTSYPSTAFRDHVGDRVRSRDVTRYDVYTPIMYYEHLTPDEVLKLHARCFASFYFRWPYLFANAHLLWPWLAKMRIGRADEGAPLGERCLLHASRHKRRTVSS